MSERMDREIEEILRRMGLEPSRRSFSARFRRMFVLPGVNLRYWLSGTVLRITPTKVMVLSLVLLGMTLLLRPAMRQASVFMGLLAVVLFFAAIVMSAQRGGGTSNERRWRGRRIDLPNESLFGALGAWCFKQWHKFRRWLR